MSSKSVTYDPEISSDSPEILQRFKDKTFIHQTHDTDGTVYGDDTRVLALVSRDTTRLGNENTHEIIHVDPLPAEYDRAVYNAGKKNTKLWVFTHDGNEIAVKYEYIEKVRELTDLSLSQIKTRARILEGPNAVSEGSSPILIDVDSEYRPVIMPWVGDLDDQ